MRRDGGLAVSLEHIRGRYRLILDILDKLIDGSVEYITLGLGQGTFVACWK